jgi:hypothetical protein
VETTKCMIYRIISPIPNVLHEARQRRVTRLRSDYEQ